MKKVLGLFTGVMLSLFVFPVVSFGVHNYDIMYDDGTYLPYENVVEYMQGAPLETLPVEGTKLVSSKDSMDEIITDEPTIQPATILGEDGREIVQDTTISPYQKIVQLYIWFPEGKYSYYIGSGFLISPDTVLTAGHCLFDRDLGGWATDVRVIVNGSYLGASSMMAPRNWVEAQGGVEHDMGALKLTRNIGEANGWFGLTQELSSPITLSGFHGDLNGKMGTQTGDIFKYSSNFVQYLLDTTGGSSGSPVYTDNQQVLAINRGSSNMSNSGVRLNNEHYNLAYYWGFQAKPEIRSIKIIDAPQELKIKESKMLNYQVLPESATEQAISWKSSSEEIATVSDTGIVTGKNVGTVTITATNPNGSVSSSCEIQIIEDDPITNFAVSGTKYCYTNSEPVQLLSHVTPATATNYEIQWHSNSPDIASVSQTGVVTPVTAGKAYIWAKITAKGFTKTVAFNFVVYDLTETNLYLLEQKTLAKGTEYKMKSHMYVPSYSPYLREYIIPDKVTFESADPSIMTVEENDISGTYQNITIKGHKAGTTNLIMTVYDGENFKTTSSTITVLPDLGNSFEEAIEIEESAVREVPLKNFGWFKFKTSQVEIYQVFLTTQPLNGSNYVKLFFYDAEQNYSGQTGKYSGSTMYGGFSYIRDFTQGEWVYVNVTPVGTFTEDVLYTLSLTPTS